MNLGKLTTILEHAMYILTTIHFFIYAGDETCGTHLQSYRAGIIALSLIVIIQTALLVGLLVKIFLAKRSNTHIQSLIPIALCHNVQDLRRRR